MYSDFVKMYFLKTDQHNGKRKKYVVYLFLGVKCPFKDALITDQIPSIL